MKKANGAWRGVVAAAAMVLGGCGGGGGGGGGGLPLMLPAANPPATNPDTPKSVSLSGIATYESVPNTTGALAYGSISVKPVRAAAVEVLGAGSTVLASTSTDDSGAYSVTVPSNTQVFVRVKAQASRSGSGPSWDVSVRDNTHSDALYVMDSPTFSSGAAALTRDLRATTGWGGSGYSGPRVAAPFAVLDTAYTAMQKVLSVAPGTAFPALRVFWSVNNVSSSGSRALGQIGTTMFTSSSVGGTVTSRSIYVLGQENVDTDEYDASVIAHEWGHYYQSAFSRDDSPGGSHSVSQRVDRRLAFSEGWGNAWSGIALARRNYTDSSGAQQADGFSLDLATGPSTLRGWYREQSIQAIFWNLNQQAGFQSIHAAMTGPFKDTRAVTSIHPFTAAFNAVASGSAGVLAGLLQDQSISAASNDPFGSQETNNGGWSSALPMYGTATLGGPGTRACVSNSFGSGNKLGSFAYLRVNVPAAVNRQISVAGPAGTDPDFKVYGGRLLGGSDSATSPTETATVGLLAGDNVIVINDFNDAGADTCFTVTIN